MSTYSAKSASAHQSFLLDSASQVSPSGQRGIRAPVVRSRTRPANTKISKKKTLAYPFFETITAIPEITFVCFWCIRLRGPSIQLSSNKTTPLLILSCNSNGRSICLQYIHKCKVASMSIIVIAVSSQNLLNGISDHYTDFSANQ